MMSDTLSQDPDGLGAPYVSYALAPSYPQTPAIPSSTVQDAPPGANLPPFSTFAADMDSGGAFSSVSDRLFSDTRLLDISNWDYYTETRVLDRGENGLSIITSQPQYRPWESKPVDASTSTYAGTTPINTLAEAFAHQNGASKLPSFQSQFQSFSEAVTTTEPTLTTLTNLTPVSPNSSSPQSHSLTTLNSNFHTLSAVNVNPRSYPLVPAPIQAREIPSIQQQFLDERHIQLYSHPPGNITLNNAIHPTFLNSQNGAIIKNNQLISSPTVVTVLKSEPDIKLGANLAALHQESIKLQNVGLHPTQFQNPMTQIPNTDGVLFNGVDKKLNSSMTSPTRNDFRKKERRKIRASSLESSIDSDGASSNMDIGSENSGQVAAISSTAGYKTTHQMHVNSSVDMDTDISGGSVDKQVKKKRKRCGECVGCQRKDNCGDCAPCRNDKSHQICKQRRCEKLTEKKNLYQDGFLRGESRRGRGKGRGGASYRGRKPTGSAAPLGGGSTLVSPETNGSSVVASSVQPSSRPSSQPAQVQQTMPVQQQPMTPMPFYADPNRFPTPVWQADPSQGWTQGQFIQQIPATGQPIEAYQQYPNGIYQTTYQQPAFETNTFYTGAVQVLTNPRPPSAPNQQVQLAPARPNSNYSHTPSPSPVQQQQQNATGRQYQEYIGQQTGSQQQNNQQGFIQSGSSQTGNDTSQTGNNSRPSSVNTIMNPPTPNQNFSPQQQQQQQQQQGQQQNNQQSNNTYTSISNFSPNPTVNYVNANSGNAQPGYPQVNSSSPQLTSHSSSGYPGQEQYSGQDQWQNDGQIMWEHQVKMEPNYDQEQYMQEVNNSPAKMENLHHNLQSDKPFSQADKVNLNTRIKTMILNKQQENNKMEESKAVEQNSTGHFLSYSHHQHLKKHLGDDGGFQNRYDSKNILDLSQRHIPWNPQKFAQTKPVQNIQNQIFHHTFERNYYPNSLNHNVTVKQEYGETLEFDHYNNIRIRQREPFDIRQSEWRRNEYIQSGHHRDNKTPPPMKTKRTSTPLKGKPSPDKCNKQQLGVGMEIPDCKCFPSDQSHPEPGIYYTHLGCADNLKSLRHDLESRTGVTGESIRIEKLRYTGKEGKTSQGCPIAKWVIRRQNEAEKYLVLVKQRTGHHCRSTFIVIGLVAWEGVPQENADDLYAFLTDKLNRFGLPTKRRCATNDPRTCACQGVDENTCGASFTFGCSWSMYYNGCKFTRSKDARKFRLTEKNEEETVERKLQDLSDQISPVYRTLAPQSFHNQTVHESTAFDCRLGTTPGRPFCGVTACVDFCAHSHKDMHNMTDGCTVVVTLTKYKGLSKPPDEQLHVLPMYVPEDTDEFGSRENQNQKVLNGGIEVLEKYPCEVRTSSSPAEKCVVRRSKKNKDQEPKKGRKKKSTTTPEQPSTSRSPSTSMDDIIRNDEVQNNQVSSTVLGYPNKSTRMRYDSFCNSSDSSFSSMYLNRNENVYGTGSYPSTPSPSLPEFSIFKTPPPPYYSPHDTYSNPYYTPPSSAFSFNSYSPQLSSPSPYGISNPFDDLYSTSILPTSCDETSKKTVDISYTDNLECFQDGEIGGVAISLPHGSVLFECAKHEVHATTALKTPNRLAPTRISLVFYQHKSMNKPQHGWLEYSEKIKLKLDPSADLDQLEFGIKTNSDIVVRNNTLPSYTFSTVFPMYPCMVTGPYQEIEKS